MTTPNSETQINKLLQHLAETNPLKLHKFIKIYKGLMFRHIAIIQKTNTFELYFLAEENILKEMSNPNQPITKYKDSIFLAYANEECVIDNLIGYKVYSFKKDKTPFLTQDSYHTDDEIIIPEHNYTSFEDLSKAQPSIPTPVFKVLLTSRLYDPADDTHDFSADIIKIICGKKKTRVLARVSHKNTPIAIVALKHKNLKHKNSNPKRMNCVVFILQGQLELMTELQKQLFCTNVLPEDMEDYFADSVVNPDDPAMFILDDFFKNITEFQKTGYSQICTLEQYVETKAIEKEPKSSTKH